MQSKQGKKNFVCKYKQSLNVECFQPLKRIVNFMVNKGNLREEIFEKFLKLV